MIGATRRQKLQIKVRTDWLLTALLTLCAALLSLMNGLERFDQVFHGYAVASIPMGTLIRMLQPWQALAASCLPVLLTSLLLRHSSPGVALLLMVLALSVVLGGSFLILRYVHVWIPPSAALLILILSYPIWCWRNQEAVLRRMDDELNRLRMEYPPVLNESYMPMHGLHGPVEGRLRELHMALTRVRNLRRFLTDSLDGIADPTLVSDTDGQLRFRNRAAVNYFRDLGLRPPRVGQSTAWVLGQAVSEETAMSTISQALLGPQSTGRMAPWHLDLEVQDRMGHYLILKCAPIRTDKGVFAGTVITLSDITAIRQAERKREETLRFVSHDMRAPQNSILALVYLNSDETDPQKQREGWTRIGQLARRTLRLVDDFVHLTRAESVRITHACIDLNMMLHEAMDDFWALAQARSVTLSIDDGLPQALVCGDRALLLRAVCNLLDNAVKYTPAGGRVQVSLRADGPNWQISVKDTGTGIAPEDLPQLFQPFSRVGPSARNDNNGAGLGLAFVHTVAWRHGGSVNVTSELGAGSTFMLLLPAFSEDGPVIEPDIETGAQRAA